MSKKRLSFSEQVRRAIRAGDLTVYQIAKETGIDNATFSRFLNGKGGLSIEALDALADLLGWSLNYTTKTTSKRSK